MWRRWSVSDLRRSAGVLVAVSALSHVHLEARAYIEEAFVKRSESLRLSHCERPSLRSNPASGVGGCLAGLSRDRLRANHPQRRVLTWGTSSWSLAYLYARYIEAVTIAYTPVLFVTAYKYM
jgi:hypothetical protein